MSPPFAALRAVQQFVVGEHQRHHRLDDRRAAQPDAGVVPPRHAERGDRRGRLEGGAHDDRLAGRDAAGDAAGQSRIGIVLAAQPRRGEAGADLDALDRVDRHERRGELGVELGVDRRAPAGRHAGRDAFDDRAERAAGRSRRSISAGQRARASPPTSIDPRRDLTSGMTSRATAPAATRAAVSRAEARPPPRGSRRPYLACIGAVGMAGPGRARRPDSRRAARRHCR